MTLDPSTGVISGTPTTGGNYSFTVMASNSAGDDTKGFVIGTNQPNFPVITTSSLPDGSVGTEYIHTFAAVGEMPITWSIESGTLPAGLSLNSTTGEIRGIPTAAGTFDFTIMASNDFGDATFTFTLTVNPVTGAEDHLSNELNIYPNPFTGEVHITGVETGKTGKTGETGKAVRLRIINAAGVIVHTQTSVSPDETIRLEHLPAGVYFFRVEKDGKTKTVKMVKE